MNLYGIVAVSGKPGLWKALAQNKTGFILESLDAQKTKLVANLSTAKLAALDEITVFGLDEDIKLKDIFTRIAAFIQLPIVLLGTLFIHGGHIERSAFELILTFTAIFLLLLIIVKGSPGKA